MRPPVVPDHVQRQVLEEGDLVFGGLRFPERQVPGVECLLALQVHGNGAPTHQLDKGLVGVPPLENRDQGIGAGEHQQEHLGHKGLPAAALGHNEHVGVSKRRVERGERNQLSLRGLEQHQG